MTTRPMLVLGFTLLLLAGAGAQGGDLVPHPVLIVSEWSQDWEDVSITVENPGSSTEQGSLVVFFYEDGNLTAWKVPITLPAGGSVGVGLRLSDGGILAANPEMFKGDPGSITDAPDPVMRHPVQPPEDDEGEKSPPPSR